MLNFVLSHWDVAAPIALMVMFACASDIDLSCFGEDDDWDANPMNKVGMNYMGD